MLDAGCGEGYYSERLRQKLSEKFSNVDIYGIDVSKDAVAMAAGAYKNIQYSVASVNKLPFPDCSFDIIVSLFAPISEAEFHRVLRKNGILITVSPAPRHLFGLKTAVYDSVYENEETTFVPRLLTPLKNESYSSVMTLSNNKEIYDLFMMTPYYYKTGSKGRASVEELSSLKTEIGFMFYTFIKL